MNAITTISEYEEALQLMEELLPLVDNDTSIDDADLMELERISSLITEFERSNIQ